MRALFQRFPPSPGLGRGLAYRSRSPGSGRGPCGYAPTTGSGSSTGMKSPACSRRLPTRTAWRSRRPCSQACVSSELLALTWRDVDFARGVINVRFQMTRSGDRRRLKTPAAHRDVVLMPQLGAELRRHRLASRPPGRRRADLRLEPRRAQRRQPRPGTRLPARWSRRGHLPYAAPYLRKHPDLPRARRSLRLPAAGPCQPGDHPQGLRPPLRCRAARRQGENTTRRGLQGFAANPATRPARARALIDLVSRNELRG